ncbi:cytochrome b561 [Microbulbifer donghaiensis]|uniref:Cytochrome b561 n=1 Tax=Microbulbifer donghaiensis TaxID=494016 RepID=A0A1M4ZAK5_9GAMM|nr:cytochrome b [Microbulbifer donghaiensis]SHF15071.1 cytochrome b561 [Microbulbifer donghaiensis]
MSARNSDRHYGWVAIVLHWFMAPAIIGMFALGWWMRQLSYYDPWYRQGPELHKGIGILLLALLVFRLLWKWLNPAPAAEPRTPRWQALAARAAHGAIYLLLLAIMISGYLISTADGRAIEVFGWFSVPATIQGIANQEDIAGEIHEILAWTLMALVALHALAALKHHFIDRDGTLRKILGLHPKSVSSDNYPQPKATLTSATTTTSK